jgi:hypothetical protein
MGKVAKRPMPVKFPPKPANGGKSGFLLTPDAEMVIVAVPPAGAVF